MEASTFVCVDPPGANGRRCPWAGSTGIYQPSPEPTQGAASHRPAHATSLLRGQQKLPTRRGESLPCDVFWD